jgi:hypothetical protein
MNLNYNVFAVGGSGNIGKQVKTGRGTTPLYPFAGLRQLGLQHPVYFFMDGMEKNSDGKEAAWETPIFQ